MACPETRLQGPRRRSPSVGNGLTRGSVDRRAGRPSELSPRECREARVRACAVSWCWHFPCDPRRRSIRGARPLRPGAFAVIASPPRKSPVSSVTSDGSRRSADHPLRERPRCCGAERGRTQAQGAQKPTAIAHRRRRRAIDLATLRASPRGTKGAPTMSLRVTVETQRKRPSRQGAFCVPSRVHGRVRDSPSSTDCERGFGVRVTTDGRCQSQARRTGSTLKSAR